jgi:predicted O-methyltransferase YrrM
VRAEDTHTQPSPWCPHPGWWHAPDDQATEQEVSELAAAFVRAIQPDLAVETGTYRAHTARVIAAALARNGHGTLLTVEKDPDLAAAAAGLLRRLPAEVLCGASPGVLPAALAGQRVQFAWLDSGPAVRGKELAVLLPFLDAGAVVGVHDTRPGRPPAAALDPRIFDVLTLRTPRGVSFAQVRRNP